LPIPPAARTALRLNRRKKHEDEGSGSCALLEHGHGGRCGVNLYRATVRRAHDDAQGFRVEYTRFVVAADRFQAERTLAGTLPMFVRLTFLDLAEKDVPIEQTWFDLLMTPGLTGGKRSAGDER
jgi:hypothetical protein